MDEKTTGNAGKATEKKAANDDGTMSLTDHLRELRNRLIVCLIVLAAASCFGLWRAGDLIQLLLDIGTQYGYEFVYISPSELLVEYFSVAFIFGVCVTIPVILYEIWAFSSPGLKKSEKRMFKFALVAGGIFACLGILFAYKILLPFILYFLITFSKGTGIRANISVQNYVSFLMTVFIIFAVIFELPVISVILNQIGILKVEWMKKARRYVIVVIFIVAAIITPPDVASQIMVAIPMMLLYELSIWLCGFFAKVKKKPAEESGQTAEETG